MKHVASLAFAAAMLVQGPALAVSVGAGAFGGMSVPIVQDDNDDITGQYGVRFPVNVVPLLTVEPYYAYTPGGEFSRNFVGYDYSRSGYEMSAFGVNVALGGMGVIPGFPMCPYVGIGSHQMTRTGSPDISEVGYNIGLALGFNVPPGLALQLRGELNLVATGDTSRKYANVTAGVAYKFYGTP
jgi:hypothetical protein